MKGREKRNIDEKKEERRGISMKKRNRKREKRDIDEKEE
jgi:hypothetical protein